MFNIKLENKIAKIGTDNFDAKKYTFCEDGAQADGILVRSADMHQTQFSPNLKCIARAGAGVNNIPLDRCAESGIVVFNTPGANANGVKELVIAALLLASRDIIGGVAWAGTLAGNPDAAAAVEKGKSQFGGSEILGKTLGVCGLGAIGRLVANVAISLGMKVIGYDPYLSEKTAALLDSHITIATDNAELYAKSDFITIHIPASADTKNMFNADVFAQMKDGAKLLNLSRADLVNTSDLLAALESGKLSKYVVDFPTADVIGAHKNIICIPHLGASTEESEDNCAVMAVNQTIDYLENGNIINSVNYPSVSLPCTHPYRLSVLGKNITIDDIATITAGYANASYAERGGYFAAVLDFPNPISADTLSKISAQKGVIKALAH